MDEDKMRKHYNAVDKDVLIEILIKSRKEIKRLKNMIKAEEKISDLLPDDTDFIIVRREDYNRLLGSDKE